MSTAGSGVAGVRSASTLTLHILRLRRSKKGVEKKELAPFCLVGKGARGGSDFDERYDILSLR